MENHHESKSKKIVIQNKNQHVMQHQQRRECPAHKPCMWELRISLKSFWSAMKRTVEMVGEEEEKLALQTASRWSVRHKGEETREL